MYQIDNTGPPTADEVLAFWRAIRTQCPASAPVVSSLDGCLADVLAAPGLFDGLPVITGEIGDSWLYGAPADPIKLATFREARRSLQGAPPSTSSSRSGFASALGGGVAVPKTSLSRNRIAKRRAATAQRTASSMPAVRGVMLSAS